MNEKELENKYPYNIVALRKKLHQKTEILKFVRKTIVYWKSKACPECNITATYNKLGTEKYPYPFYNCPNCIMDINGDTYMYLIEDEVMVEDK